MTTIESLQPGQVLMVGVRGTKNAEKIQFELVEHVKEPTLLQMLNKSDDRFGGNKPRHAWMTAQKADFCTMFGVDPKTIEAATPEMSIDLNILNPKMGDKPLHVEVKEYTENEVIDMIASTTSENVRTSLQYLLDNKDTRAKRKGKDGDFIMSEGQHVFSLSEVSLTQNHRFCPIDTVTLARPAAVTAKAAMTI